MKSPILFASWVCIIPASTVWGQIPENLVTENIPPISVAIRADASRYLEFRAATFQNWHPQRREMLITTRFADTPQLHVVGMPGGARRQLTFLTEPAGGGAFRPKTGEFIVFSQDTGGGEFHQLYRYDLADGRITLLTDGKSRNTGARWSKSGRWLAYTSTRRNGQDNDLYLIDPAHPESDRLLTEVSGGGWSIQDWSEDDSRLIMGEYISANESYLYLADAQSGAQELLTPKGQEKIAYEQARFAKDGKSIFVTTDRDSEFQWLGQIDLATKKFTPLTNPVRWDVQAFELSSDAKLIAFVTNEDGISVLHVREAKKGKELRIPRMPMGVMSGLQWHQNGRDLGFDLSSARSPADAYSLDVKSGKLERWTQSETGGLNPELFVEPELVKMKSFDDLQISAFVYRPNPLKFPGKRPVLINIHGGPESQSRPIFQARNNYYLNELGIAIVYPNVRGSAGYGKRFLTLDNGFKREDSVKDIGTVIDWVKKDTRFDAERIAVIGGSYGGYMVLAALVHYSDQLRAGVDVVGISNFLTFLKNTQDYRRDLRRAEYGDERAPQMRDFLEGISPASNVSRITKPLFVIQGKNDPRVPLSESEQMVRAIRERGGKVWYLMAKDEGHGFAKKKNADFQFLATSLFLRVNLLD